MELTPCSSALDFWHFLVELDIFPLHISFISILNFYYSLIFSQFEIENIIYVPFIQVIQVFKIFFVIFQIWYWPNHRDWFPKFANGLNIKIDIVHKVHTYMSDQGVFLSKWPHNRRIILAKEQLGHYYIFWTMPILIFCQFENFGYQSLCQNHTRKTKCFPFFYQTKLEQTT